MSNRVDRPSGKPDDDKLLTPIEVSEFLKVRLRTLEDWRLRRYGPALPFVRIGRTIRYRLSDLERLIADGIHVPSAKA